LTVDLQVLKHLGIGLYSNVPAVVSEMVANAYDADAKLVKITAKSDEIVIEDDGLGMNVQDANNKFLTVGYDKRRHEPAKTLKYKRKPMGRKGIGKLSAFAIADEVEVQSVKTHPKTGKELGRAAFLMEVPEIEERAKDKETYHPRPLNPSSTKLTKGTCIILRKLKKRSINEDYIRRNLARRFSVFGDKFEVRVGKGKVTPADRQYWDKLQFVWGLGNNLSYRIAKKGKKVKKSEALTGVVKVPGHKNESVSGWIGTVHLPNELKDKDIDNNGIVVMARGKLVHENLLPFARTSRIFAEYIVGEINADWLDKDKADDIATSDRQSLNEEEPRFSALREYLKERLDQIADEWSEWRKEVGVKAVVGRHPVLQGWLGGMTYDNRRQAEKLLSAIEGMPVSSLEDKKVLIKHGIMAFETLALKGNLAALSETSVVDVESMKKIMSAMEDLEVAHYYQVAKTRWTVLAQFEKLVDENAKERFLQDKIYDNLWLMDSSWERPTHEVRKEKRFIDKLKAQKLGLDRNKALSRYDIRYLTVSGRDLIVELKRSGRNMTMPEIVQQVRKYGEIMETMAKDPSNPGAPDFEIVVLVGEYPTGYAGSDESALRSYKTRMMTYEKLIEHARASYGDYLDRQRRVERIQKMVDSL
jgi:hypothetical protein